MPPENARTAFSWRGKELGQVRHESPVTHFMPAQLRWQTGTLWPYQTLISVSVASGCPWGGGGGGPRPPNLEDFIRKGQDRFKRFLPGGGGLDPC